MHSASWPPIMSVRPKSPFNEPGLRSNARQRNLPASNTPHGQLRKRPPLPNEAPNEDDDNISALVYERRLVKTRKQFVVLKPPKPKSGRRRLEPWLNLHPSNQTGSHDQEDSSDMYLPYLLEIEDEPPPPAFAGRRHHGHQPDQLRLDNEIQRLRAYGWCLTGPGQSPCRMSSPTALNRSAPFHLDA